MQVGAESRQNVPPGVELRHGSDDGGQPLPRGPERTAPVRRPLSEARCHVSAGERNLPVITLKSRRLYCPRSRKQIPAGRRIRTCSTAPSATDTPWGTGRWDDQTRFLLMTLDLLAIRLLEG